MTKTQPALEHRSIRYERTCHQFLLGGFGGGSKSSQGRTGEIRCLDSESSGQHWYLYIHELNTWSLLWICCVWCFCGFNFFLKYIVVVLVYIIHLFDGGVGVCVCVWAAYVRSPLSLLLSRMASSPGHRPPGGDRPTRTASCRTQRAGRASELTYEIGGGNRLSIP